MFKSWQKELADSFTDPLALLAYLNIPADAVRLSSETQRLFAFRVTSSYAARMQAGNPDDPLLRQVLPLSDELTGHPDFGNDPVGDLAAVVVPGLLHKYQGRVLLVLTGACAINCRYCFRRAFPYSGEQITRQRLQQALDYIRANDSIHEVILSGGDPLALSDTRLFELVQLLAAIPHLQRLRIHTRLPIVLPSRITPELRELLTFTRLQTVFVVHVNHPNELNDPVAFAMEQLWRDGIPLLNQSVLLRGVNDETVTLITLSERLFAYHIQPYYLHLLDRTSGTRHFAVTDERARKLCQDLQTALPGYLVPKMVREHAGAAYKTPLY